MNNTQRKKTKMLHSFQEGYYSPPYPYTNKVRGLPSEERYAVRFYKHGGRRKWSWFKQYAGCRVCDGYGYVHAGLESEDCVCVTEHNGTYSKKAYRFWN